MNKFPGLMSAMLSVCIGAALVAPFCAAQSGATLGAINELGNMNFGVTGSVAAQRAASIQASGGNISALAASVADPFTLVQAPDSGQQAVAAQATLTRMSSALAIDPQNADKFLTGVYTKGKVLGPEEAIAEATIGENLADLKTKGYATFLPEAILEPGFNGRVLEQLNIGAISADNTPSGEGDLYSFWNKEKGWIGDIGYRKDGTGGLKDFVAVLTAALTRILPSEKLILHQVQLRRGDLKKPQSHNDPGWLTLTYSLRGDGTWIYPSSDSGKVVKVPPGIVAVITGIHRRSATSIPATWHSAPGGDTKDRVLILLRFRSADFAVF